MPSVGGVNPFEVVYKRLHGIALGRRFTTIRKFDLRCANLWIGYRWENLALIPAAIKGCGGVRPKVPVPALRSS